MTASEQRKGFRLPWLGDEASPDDAAGSDSLNHSEAPVAASAGAPAEAADPFTVSLVDAMRRTAEKSRDETLSGLRKSAAERVTEARANNEQQAVELRAASAADVKKVGEWERGEISGIRAEGAARVAERQVLLEEQLANHTAAGERVIEAIDAGVEAYETQFREFFAELLPIRDPVAFAAAAKRIPQLPAALAAPEPVAPIADPWGDPALKAKTAVSHARKVDTSSKADATPKADASPKVEAPPKAEASPIQKAATPAEPVPAEPAPAEPVPMVTTKAEPASGEQTTTQIVAHGLNSFGEITGFKHSLESADGIERVVIGLGPSGEFNFMATHASGFDLEAAIRAFQSAAEFRASDGRLDVTLTNAA
ncbi:MAG TPA: hypothetical protein VJA85_09450 [Candidatus Limnocylindria bacterium]|nr:hypothetical protein [Candidatus Limnocylindria bacterium]